MLKNTILSLIRFMMSPADGQGGGVGGTNEKYPEPEDEDVTDEDADEGDEDGDGDQDQDGKDTDGSGNGDEAGDADEGDQGQDEGDGKPKPEDKPKKPQDPETNARMKALRLQREAEERARREREAELAKARDEGLMEALGHVNPYTGKKIEDDVDLETYRIMKAIKDRGGDPIADFADESAKLKRQAKADAQRQASEAEERQKTMREEVSRFAEEFPKVDLSAVLASEDFRKFSTEGNLIERVGLIQTYRLYEDHVAAAESRRRGAKDRSDARRAHSTGPLAGGSGTPSDIYSLEELNNLTEEEAAANIDKAIRSQQYHARHKKNRN